MKKVLYLHTVVYFLFALALFFIPDTLWPLYGVEINDQYARFLSQHTSIFLGGISIFGLMLSKLPSEKKLDVQIIKSLVLIDLTGVIITLYGALTGIFTGFGWSDPIFFGIMFLISLNQLFKLVKTT